MEDPGHSLPSVVKLGPARSLLCATPTGTGRAFHIIFPVNIGFMREMVHTMDGHCNSPSINVSAGPVIGEWHCNHYHCYHSHPRVITVDEKGRAVELFTSSGFFPNLGNTTGLAFSNQQHLRLMFLLCAGNLCIVIYSIKWAVMRHSQSGAKLCNHFEAQLKELYVTNALYISCENCPSLSLLSYSCSVPIYPLCFAL